MHKIGRTEKGDLKHYSVGIIIERKNKILLIDRVNFPYGWACPAGHIDQGENPHQAIERETQEETGCRIKNLKLIAEIPDMKNECALGIKYHHWYGFRGEISGKINICKDEARDWQWVAKDKLKDIDLEPAWEQWFKKIGWIK